MARTMNRQDDAELIGYFHLAKTALSNPSRYDRLVWAAKQYSKKHSDITRTKAYLRVDELTRIIR